jgi:hypothetical protein
MTIRHCGLWLALGLLSVGGAAPLRAQYAPAPDVYTVKEISAMMGGPGETMIVYRDGSKAVIDITPPAGAAAGTIPVRSVYDLTAQTNISWDPTASAPTCGAGRFSGDWGDPFAGSASMVSDLTKQGAKKVGTEMVNGFSTDVYELVDPASKATYKAWIDTKYGLMIKLQTGDQVLQEITQLTLAPPPAALFTVPASCGNVAPPAPMLTDAQKIAADTGGDGTNYVYAHLAPADGSPTSCTVVFKAVKAGTLAPIPINYAIGLDLNQNDNGGENVHYSTDAGLAGTAKFSGGEIKDVSSQIHNGVLRIPNAPKHFYMDVEFGNTGTASALIYRQCFGPETTLLLVVKNVDNFSDGADWLWSKEGK